jgi:hypothetical protein
MIEVEQKSDEQDPMLFNVVISDSAGKTQHRVTLTAATYGRLTDSKITPVECVEAAFRFLLEREAKSDILPSFDINVIQMYFSNFEKEFSNYI